MFDARCNVIGEHTYDTPVDVWHWLYSIWTEVRLAEYGYSRPSKEQIRRGVVALAVAYYREAIPIHEKRQLVVHPCSRFYEQVLLALSDDDGVRHITGDMNLAHLENLRTEVLDREFGVPPGHLLPPPSF